MAGQEWNDTSRAFSIGGIDAVAEAGVASLVATAPVEIAGVIRPAGWNTAYLARRALADTDGSTLCEVTVHGDSTTYGQVQSNAMGSAGEYSLVNKLRSLSVAAGHVDGGQGLLGLQDNAAMSGADNIAAVVALGSGAAAGNTSLNFHGAYGVGLPTLGATCVVQTKASKLRVWRHRTTTAGTGQYTYNVNGGAEQAATTCVDTSGSNTDFQIQNIVLGSPGTLKTINFTNSVAGTVELAFEAINSAGGQVFHKQGISGVLLGNEFPSQDATGTPGAKIPPRFGLMLGSGAGSQLSSQYGVALTKTANVRTGMHVLNLSINDLLNATSLADARTRADTCQASVVMFGRLLEQDVGSSGIVCIPHLGYATGARTYEGLFRSSIINPALALGVAIADLMVPLGGHRNYAANGSSVHLTAAAYDLQASFLWNNFLNVA